MLEYAKRIFLDTVACILGGTQVQPRHGMVRQFGLALGGPPEATMLGTGDRVGADAAAAVNAEAGGALSAHESLYFMHSANLTAAVALAISERAQASGRRLLEAFVLAYEVTAVLGLFRPPPAAWPPDAPVHRSRDVHSSVGAAAAAARVLGLDVAQTRQALALAAASAPGDARAARLELASYATFSQKALAGIAAAVLAREGFTGYTALLDDAVVSGLGSTWWTLDACFKRHPTCRYLSSPLDQLELLLLDERISADELEHIVVYLAPLGYDNRHIRASQAAHQPGDPAEPLNLVFNPAYQVAMVALGVPPGPAWHDPAWLADERVRAVMARVELAEDLDLGARMRDEGRAAPHGRPRSCGGSGVTVHARGRRFDRRSDAAFGDPWSAETRLSDDQLHVKFRAFAKGVLGGAGSDRAFELLLAIDELDEVGELTAALSAS